jgi:2-oxoisovalerate dehydrogenase E1 component alpha subunit
MGRFERFLKHCGVITDSELANVHKEEKRAVLKAMGDAEKRPPPALEELFTDVYYDKPPRLEAQQAQLLEHLKKHKSKY